MREKIFSLIVAVITVLGTTAGAFGETYPESTGFVAFDEGGIDSQKDSYTHTNQDNIFMVDGKKFILLDTDSEGNYFVMTEDDYGRHEFETSVESHITVEEATAENGEYSFTRVNDINNDDWIFNPNNSSSIAYWLNNDFYENGNGEGNILPENIKNHILERDWQIEGFKTYSGSGTRLYDQYFNGLGVSGYTPSEVIASQIVQKPYSVRCKIALMSFSEYMEYQKIIGISFSFSSWGGMMLRSQDAFLTTGNENLHTNLKFYFGPLQVFAPSKESSSKLKVNVADAPNKSYYYVRPVFWLSSDFFSNVKCDVSSLGKYPKQFITNNSYNELKRIYTDEEIAAMGIVKPEGDIGTVSPFVTDVDFIGDTSALKPLYGTYVYNKNSDSDSKGLLEYLTQCQWYISDTINGKKYPIPNGDSLEFIPQKEHVGKFVWFAVTPKNAFNNSGETVFSKKIVKIRENKNVTVGFFDSGNNPITKISDDGIINIKISYQLKEKQNAAAYIAQYDSNRSLTNLKTLTLSGEGEENVSMEIPQGMSCKVIVLGETEGSPYCIQEIKY